MFARRAERDHFPLRSRNELRDAVGGGVLAGREVEVDVVGDRDTSQQPALRLLLAKPARLDERGGSRRQEDLPCIGLPFAPHCLGCTRTRDEQLGMASRHREQPEAARVHPLRNAQLHACAGRRDDRLGDERSHRERAPARARRVRGAGVENQQRVAAELEDVAAFTPDDRDHAVEAVVQDFGELFGTFLPDACQPLRQFREAREVGREQRPFDLEETGRKRRRTAVDEQLRHVVPQLPFREGDARTCHERLPTTST